MYISDVTVFYPELCHIDIETVYLILTSQTLIDKGDSSVAFIFSLLT